MKFPNSKNTPPPVTKKGGFSYSDLVFRVVIMVLVAASVSLLWWSYSRVFAPRIKASHEMNTAVARLSAEVDDLNGKWSSSAIEQINQKFDQVQPSLFAGQPALESWLADFHEQLAALGLDLKTEFQKIIVPDGMENKLLIIPTTVYIELQPGTNSAGMSSYQRVLQLTQNITAHEQRSDLTELTVDGGTNSISHAVMSFNFWADGKEAK
jgi:hypothetical protein